MVGDFLWEIFPCAGGMAVTVDGSTGLVEAGVCHTKSSLFCFRLTDRKLLEERGLRRHLQMFHLCKCFLEGGCSNQVILLKLFEKAVKAL